jgi:hypothetical protein
MRKQFHDAYASPADAVKSPLPGLTSLSWLEECAVRARPSTPGPRLGYTGTVVVPVAPSPVWLLAERFRTLGRRRNLGEKVLQPRQDHACQASVGSAVCGDFADEAGHEMASRWRRGCTRRPMPFVVCSGDAILLVTFLEGVAKMDVVARMRRLRLIASAPGATDRAPLAVGRPRERGRKPRADEHTQPQQTADLATPS